MDVCNIEKEGRNCNMIKLQTFWHFVFLNPFETQFD